MSLRREPPHVIPPGTLLAGDPRGRRWFAPTSARILVFLIATAGLSPGCSSTDLLQSGTLTVKVLGLGTSPAPSNGGTVLVTTSGVSGNVAFPGTLPDSGIATGAVPPGDYTITYTPPGGYLLANGEVATKSAHVTSGQPTEVDFNVVVAPAPTGTLAITVTGLGGSATSGGSADVLRTDVGGQTPQTVSIPANGSIDLTIVAGTYSVAYTAPSGFSVAGGVTNPLTGKVVSAGATATVSFAVQAVPTTGTLQVNVTGLTGSPANGGSAVAQRTDAAGAPITIAISAAGSGTNSSVPAGTYTITYTPPSGFAVAGGATNPVTGKVVSAGATATVAFAVQAIGSPSVDTVFAEGFESGSFAVWDDRGAPANQAIVTDAANAHSGSRMLEVTFPLGGDGGWLSKFFMPGYDSIYVSYWVRFQSGWQSGTKLLQVLGSRTDNQWSGTGKAGVCPSGTDFFYLGVVQERSGNPGPTHFYSYYPGMGQSPPGSGVCYGLDGSAVGAQYTPPLEILPPSWHRVEFWVVLNTPGQSNLSQRFCVDGVLRGQWSGISVRSSSMLLLNSVTISNSIAGGSPQTQKMWVDDLVVTRQRPSGAC